MNTKNPSSADLLFLRFLLTLLTPRGLTGEQNVISIGRHAERCTMSFLVVTSSQSRLRWGKHGGFAKSGSPTGTGNPRSCRDEDVPFGEETAQNWSVCAQLPNREFLSAGRNTRRSARLICLSRERKPWPVVVAAALPCRCGACPRKSRRQAGHQLCESSNQATVCPPRRHHPHRAARPATS